MNKNTTLYLTHAVLWQSDSVQPVISTLRYLKWYEPKTIVGIKELAVITRGRFNPSGDFALLMPDNELVRDVFDLIHWFDRKGLRPI